MSELWIAQITDSHIVPKEEMWFGKAATKVDMRLKKVVNFINTLKPLPEFVIHTGDVTESGDVESYRYARGVLNKLKIPYYLTCGNHDNYKNLREVFSDHQYFVSDKFSHYSLELTKTKIIVLDTQIPGKTWGVLCTERLEWLRAELKTNKDILIFMHHYPFDVQHLFFNTLRLQEVERFAEVIKDCANIKGIFCGHYHFGSAALFAGKFCWISPSTAPSFCLEDLSQSTVCNNFNLSPAAFSLHHLKYGILTSRAEVPSKVIDRF